MMQTNGLFPLRLLGFSFYWAWLFLVAVSPSPVFGLVMGPLDAPFELLELCLRSLFLLIIIIFSKTLATSGGKNILLFTSAIVGSLGTLIMFYLGSTDVMIFPAILIALADASMFILWLCFFGHMKLGETALLLALSYAIGSVICLIVMNLDGHLALGCSIALPLLSGISFYMSHRFYSKQENNEEMFSSKDINTPALEPTFPYVKRMLFALALCALVFGLYTSAAIEHSFDLSISGPYIEAPCCIVLGIFIAIIIRTPKRAEGLYALYRVIPLLLCVGLVSLLVLDKSMYVVSGVCIMVGYLAFEIFVLNDVCNAVKARGMSLLRTMGIARLSISVGMFMGWFIGCSGTLLSLPQIPSLAMIVGIGVIVVIVVSTLVFTEKELFSIRGVASERAIIENAGSVQEEGLQQYLESYSKHLGLSSREIEVLFLLPKGRNTQYISDSLFIASGTVKTHVYNIYRKADVHTKMELLDQFERFQKSEN